MGWKKIAAVSVFCVTGAACVLSGSARPANARQAGPAAICDAETVAALVEENATAPFFLSCSVTLPPRIVLKRNIIIEGAEASNLILDCNGSTIDTSRNKGRMPKTAIQVRSRQMENGQWSAPRSVTIQNCNVNGFMRVYGLDENANGENMKASASKPDHTAFAQKAAPRGTSFINLAIDAPGGTPLYIGPGVTRTTLANSRVTGTSTSTAVYIDAESARNSIVNNVFSIRTEKREQIAIDGSTRNVITGNVFNDPVNGGVYLYRNCGEGGVIRHQKPNFNVIANNRFNYSGGGGDAKPAVWAGSRGGKQRYCFIDPARPFGSSKSSMDFAEKNTIEGNRLVGGREGLIRDDGRDNVVRNNKAD